jgi:hypothetical protein
MRENGYTIKWKERVKLLTQMTTSMKVNLFRTKLMVVENLLIRLKVLLSLASGKTINLMVTVNKYLTQALTMRAISIKDVKMVTVCTNGQMKISMMACGKTTLLMEKVLSPGKMASTI